MHKLRLKIAAALAAITLAASVTPVSAHNIYQGDKWMANIVGAYTNTVIVCHWDANPLPGGYGGSYWEAMHRAVNTWNAVGGELHFSLSATPCSQISDTPFMRVGMRNVITDIARGDPHLDWLCLSSGPPCVDWANIWLESDVAWYTGTGITPSQLYDAETAFLHEIGHTLRLGHSDHPADVMYGSLAYGESRRYLTYNFDKVSYASAYGWTH